MLRTLSLTLCLLLPMSAFAQDPVTPPPDAPAVEAQPSLIPPEQAAPAAATEGTRSCGMRHGCSRRGGAVKAIVITGVVGSVIAVVAIGIAVGVANTQPVVPR